MISTPNSVWRPYSQEWGAPPSIKLKSAKGSFLYSESGQEIFDGISSWWLITHGHCTPQISEAIASQASKLDQVTFANFTHAPAEELAELLIKITPTHLQKVFYTDNGSTAVEAALKMCLQACQQKGEPQRKKIIAFEHAYHGDTVGAMSVSADGIFTKAFRPWLFDVLRAKHPVHSKAPWVDYVEHFETLLHEHHNEVAGVIIEPMLQGAGGMLTWPAEAVNKIGKLCRQFGIYLIFDEVMTGFGRTGELFALEHLEIVPDLLCVSKGLTGGSLPLAATLCSQEIYEAFLSPVKDRMFFHGHSFTANPISCAAAVANIKLFLLGDFSNQINDLCQVQKECLAAVAGLPIKDKRQCGTVAAIEVDVAQSDYASNFSNLIRTECLEQGFYTRPLGGVFYVMPPFSSSTKDIKTAWEILEKTLKRHL